MAVLRSAPPQIRVCVVGFGLSGRVFHAPFVSAVPGLHLQAIVSSRREEIGRLWPGVPVFPSLSTALTTESCDLVVVATPNETHLELAMEALRAGAHVVIDKPIAATAAEVRELAQLARQQGRVMAPFHNRRWDGDFLTLQQILTQEVLGRVVTLSSRFDRFRPLVRQGSWKEAGGGMHGLLWDLGPHLVDQMLSLFGPPETITASVRREREGTAIEDAFDMWLQYPGFRVMLGSSLQAADPQPRFLVHGTRGSFRKRGVDPQEPALVGGATVPSLDTDTPWLPEADSAWGELTVAADPSRPDDLQRTRVETIPGDYRQFYRNVRDVIRGEAALAVTADDAWRTMRLLELARESSRTGQQLPVSFE